MIEPRDLATLAAAEEGDHESSDWISDDSSDRGVGVRRDLVIERS